MEKAEKSEGRKKSTEIKSARKEKMEMNIVAQ